tara:strand:+ start:1075 stop:1707 length:633 start_codon:yes stop_codon:yes gene_type:complete
MTIRRLCLAPVSTVVAVLIFGFSATVAAQATPQEQFIDELIHKAVKVLELPLEASTEREAGFRALLNQNFDMPTIIRLVLGRHWRTATPGQKARFAQVFRTHLVRVYTSQLGVYEGEIMEIEKSAALSKKDTVIYTLVMLDEEDVVPLRVDWRVRETDDGLKVIDVAAEGVSMLTTKRSEFTSLVAREGVEALIGKLEDMNVEPDQATDS